MAATLRESNRMPTTRCLVFHHKQDPSGRDAVKSNKHLHLNSAVGKLFSTGMGLQDKKEDLEPRHRQQPHRSQAMFNDKKTKHATPHHSTPRAELTKKPSPFLKCTFSGGMQSPRSERSGMGSSRNSLTGGRSRRGDGEPKYCSQAELCLDKRRHQAKMDGELQAFDSSGMSKSQRSTGRSTFGGYPESNAGSGYAESERTVVAGLQTPGFQDLCAMEPRNRERPHTSVQEFNMKKEQHLTSLHKNTDYRGTRYGV